MTLIAYFDGFGHIGPFVSRSGKRHNDHPVFGLAGIVIPLEQARSFATWFYQRKCQLLKWEIDNQPEHTATGEKKGSALCTHKNVSTYAELRQFTNRFLNKSKSVGGLCFMLASTIAIQPNPTTRISCAWPFFARHSKDLISGESYV